MTANRDPRLLRLADIVAGDLRPGDRLVVGDDPDLDAQLVNVVMTVVKVDKIMHQPFNKAPPPEPWVEVFLDGWVSTIQMPEGRLMEIAVPELSFEEYRDGLLS